MSSQPRYIVKITQDFRLNNQLPLKQGTIANLCGEIRFDRRFMKRVVSEPSVYVDCYKGALSIRETKPKESQSEKGKTSTKD